MAIQPTSDIISDVASSADPARQTAALRKLAEIGGDGGQNFATQFALLSSPKLGSGDFLSAYRSSLHPISNFPLNQAAQASADPATKMGRDFEALLLQSTIEQMMPTDKSVFGKGTAGSVWKSMLSHELAQQMSKSGVLGVAEKTTHALKVKIAQSAIAAHIKPTDDVVS